MTKPDSSVQVRKLGEEDVVGYVWTKFRFVEDGAGGFSLEPQDRTPVRVRDLAPGLQRFLRGGPAGLGEEWGLWAGGP
jgi:hypothetical protein